jgi:ribosomal protein S18 acetylase RimI-like enzyme
VSDGVEVRTAQEDEYAAVGELTLDGYVHDGFLTRETDYAEHLLDAAHRAIDAELVVAVDADGLLGTVTFCPPGSPLRELSRDGEAEFRMLAVAPSARGRGVGRALVEHCFTRARELGLEDMVICSMSRMTAAHRLYDAMGFVREPALDWEPVPDVLLLAFRRPV